MGRVRFGPKVVKFHLQRLLAGYYSTANSTCSTGMVVLEESTGQRRPPPVKLVKKLLVDSIETEIEALALTLLILVPRFQTRN